jgi:hypothetical protein
MRRGIALVGIASVLALGAGAASALEAVDPALLATVETALANTRAFDSLRISTQSLTQSSTPMGDLNIQNDLAVDVVRAENDWNAAGTTSVLSELPAIGALEIEAEIVRLDGISYVRFGEMPDGLPLELPQTWTATDDLDAGGGILPLPTTAETLLGSLMLPIAADSVTSIAALPDDEIDGQAMRVTQIALDPAVVLESDAAGLLAVGGGGPAGGFGGGNLPGNFTPPDGAQIPDEIVPPSPEDIQVTLAVYVGADDGLVHRIYLLVNVTGSADGSTPATTVTTISDYANFGEPVEIVMPTVGE